MTSADWDAPEGRLLVLRRALPDPAQPGRVDVTLLLCNAAAEPRPCVLPAPTLAWTLALDSARPRRRPRLAMGAKRSWARAPCCC